MTCLLAKAEYSREYSREYSINKLQVILYLKTFSIVINSLSILMTDSVQRLET